MPAYNAERYIEEAIESILTQTYTYWELLIIDDGSTDATLEIARRYMARDMRIRTDRHHKNMGVSATRNELIADAKGKYVAWMDADDISLPDRIRQQVLYMEVHEHVGICGGYLEFIDDGKKTLSVRRYAQKDAELRAHLFRFSGVSQGAAMVRLDILRRTRLYDSSLSQAEDLDILFQLAALSKMANLSLPVLRYRWNGTSATYNRLKQNIVATLRVRLRAVRSYGYRMSFLDVMHFVAATFMLMMPRTIVYVIFNRYRNS